MELNIISTHENKTIGRKEISFAIIAEPGAKRAEIKTELCKKASLDPNSTIVVRINNSFGSMTSMGIAHSYQNEEALKRYESRHLLERLGVIAKKDGKPQAAKASAPAKEEKK